MTFDVFVMILCGFIMTALVAFFSILIVNIVKLRIKLVNAGLLDEEIKEETTNKKKQNKVVFAIFKIILPILLCVCLGVVFVFSLYVKKNESSHIAVPKVVKSESMSYRNEKNKYLDVNNLTNQFQRFDVIFLEPMPDQKDLKIYDVVAYEKNDILVIHRIVGEYEKDGETLYLLRGDANLYNDYQYVKYSQMKGIYKGKRLVFIGSVVLFFQSPAGWMCIIMCAFISIILPIADKKMLKSINDRLVIINQQEKKEDKVNDVKIKKKQNKKKNENDDIK